MSDRLTSLVRTAVPTLWSALVAWVVAKFGLSGALAGILAGLGEQLVVPAVLAVVYAVLRWVEPRLPNWLTRILLGSARPPRYGQPPLSLTD